jgi:hypothetical protein
MNSSALGVVAALILFSIPNARAEIVFTENFESESLASTTTVSTNSTLPTAPSI